MTDVQQLAIVERTMENSEYLTGVWSTVIQQYKTKLKNKTNESFSYFSMSIFRSFSKDFSRNLFTSSFWNYYRNSLYRSLSLAFLNLKISQVVLLEIPPGVPSGVLQSIPQGISSEILPTFSLWNFYTVSFRNTSRNSKSKLLEGFRNPIRDVKLCI